MVAPRCSMAHDREHMPLRLFVTMTLCCGFAAAQSSGKIDFAKQVAPIFQSHCYTCHGPDVQMSALRLDNGASALRGGNSGQVIKPGHAADSPLVLRISGAKGIGPMPPAGPRLSDQQIALIRAWIDQGANWPGVDVAKLGKPGSSSSHWAFQPIRVVSPPAVSNPEWVRNPIDAFVLARLDREKIKPSPEASKAQLLRRVSLDLTGIPPTPEQIDTFVADQRPNAYEHQVDRLLESPQFGEKWARHWLDKARYADSDGYEKDWFRPWAWRYRDWVINAINSDMPFDEFTIKQLAGDLLPDSTTRTASPPASIATP